MLINKVVRKMLYDGDEKRNCAPEEAKGEKKEKVGDLVEMKHPATGFFSVYNINW
jgi:hypothetical protein